MTLINFSESTEVILAICGLTAIVFSRYVLISGAFYILFYSYFKDSVWHRKISEGLRPPGQSRSEIKWSAITSFIFALSGVGMVWLWQEGYTAVYTDFRKYGLLYLPISLGIGMFIHETYYYWLHRWMHRPKIYRWIHKTHHDSIITSPWTSFSFHPMESILQAIVIPFIVIFLPMHNVVIMTMLILMTVSATINHLDIEIYPKNAERHWFGKWIIGATHHSMHHAKFIKNFGLYFTFWDKWMGTESEEFEALFREKTQESESKNSSTFSV